MRSVYLMIEWIDKVVLTNVSVDIFKRVFHPKQDTYSRTVLIGLIYSRPLLIEIMSAYDIETGSCADLSSKPRAHMLTARAATSYDKTHP